MDAATEKILREAGALPEQRRQGLKEVITGLAKAATTDLPGFIADIADKLAGDTSTLGEKDRSSQMFEALTGVKSTGSLKETIAGLFSPGGLGKTMVVAAAKAGKDVDTAKKLLKQGMSPATVFQQTGVYKEDGIFKTVISDAAAKIDLDKVERQGYAKLADVVDHPELFKAYPELKTISVLQSGRGGFYAPKYNNIGIALGSDVEGLMLHEIQHAIQKTSKFKSRGADPDYLMDKGYSYDDAMKLYSTNPGEREARFTQGARNMRQSRLEAEVLELLRAEATPSYPAELTLWNPGPK